MFESKFVCFRPIRISGPWSKWRQSWIRLRATPKLGGYSFNQKKKKGREKTSEPTGSNAQTKSRTGPVNSQ